MKNPSAKNYIVGENSPQPTVIEFADDATIDDAKRAAIEHGLTTETDPTKLQVYVEDDESDVEGSQLLRDLPTKGKRRRIYCGRCRKLVTVTVHFDCREVRSKFWAGSRLQRVIDWATRELELSDADADDLVLRLNSGDGDPLDLDFLLASVVRHGGKCAIAFFLTPDVLVNG